MNSLKQLLTVTGGLACGVILFWAVGVFAEGKYPVDYKPSTLAEQGETNVLARVFAVAAYMTDKINAAGGKDSPVCYRNCMTTALNDTLKCTESLSSYASSETCEMTGAQKMSTCDPKCK